MRRQPALILATALGLLAPPAMAQRVLGGFQMDDHTKVHHANGVVGIEQIPGCAAGTTLSGGHCVPLNQNTAWEGTFVVRSNYSQYRNLPCPAGSKELLFYYDRAGDWGQDWFENRICQWIDASNPGVVPNPRGPDPGFRLN